MTVEALPNRRLRITHTHARAQGDTTTVTTVQATATIMDPDGTVTELDVTESVADNVVTTVAEWTIPADAKPWSHWYGVVVTGDLEAAAKEEIVVADWPFA